MRDGNTRVNAEEFGTRGLGKGENVGRHGAKDRDWRLDFQRMEELELREIPDLGAILAGTFGSVLVRSLNRLKSSGPEWQPANESSEHQGIDNVESVALRPRTEVSSDFFIRWGKAMRSHMGADEYERYLLAMRKRAHERKP